MGPAGQAARGHGRDVALLLRWGCLCRPARRTRTDTSALQSLLSQNGEILPTRWDYHLSGRIVHERYPWRENFEARKRNDGDESGADSTAGEAMPGSQGGLQVR